MELGRKISLHRKRMNLTQDALAQKLGVTNQAVSKWEADQCCPDIQLLPQLADILGITIDALFGRESVQKKTVAGLDWPDDDTLRVVFYVGHELVANAKADTDISFVYEGPALNITSAISVKCGDVQGNVDAGTDVVCGNVYGSVDAGTEVRCGDVEGSVDAGVNVSCGNVGGDVDAGCNVNCGDIGGDVDAGVCVQSGNATGPDNTVYIHTDKGNGVPNFVKDMLSDIFGKKDKE